MILLRYTVISKASDTVYKVLEIYTKTAIVEADKAKTSLVRTTLFLYTLKYYYPSSGTGGGGGKKAAPTPNVFSEYKCHVTRAIFWFGYFKVLISS